MPRFEYKLVPAPEKATKHKGLKGAVNFAATLEDILNELGTEGWHYLRAETLPQEERAGLASKVKTYRNLLVFQREIPDPAPDEPVLEAQAAPAPEPAPDPPAKPAEPVEDHGDASLANLFVDPPEAPTPPDRSRD